MADPCQTQLMIIWVCLTSTLRSHDSMLPSSKLTPCQISQLVISGTIGELTRGYGKVFSPCHGNFEVSPSFRPIMLLVSKLGRKMEPCMTWGSENHGPMVKHFFSLFPQCSSPCLFFGFPMYLSRNRAGLLHPNDDGYKSRQIP